MNSKSDINLDLLLSKILDGSINQDDNDKLRAYIESGWKDEKLNEILLKHWEILDQKEITAIDESCLERIKEQIQTKIYETIPEEKNVPVKWIHILAKAAAILIIPLMVASVYISYDYGVHKGQSEIRSDFSQEIIASPGSRVHFILPDQTEVWLNSGSKLKFPNNIKTGIQRRVKLSGQGYFQVSHNAEQPFFVETSNLTVKVLGTAFDISCYENDDRFCSTLEKGSISILNKNNEEIGKLVPGEKAVMENQQQSLLISKVDTKLFTSWKDGKLIFRNTPLVEVTRQMERWFNCNITIDPELINSGICYTANIRQETIEEVLKMIEISTHVKTKIENRNVKIWK
jgi:transmembrane sensor